MPAAHAAALAELSEERTLSAYVVDARTRLRESWSPESGGRPWGQRHAELIDAVLKRLVALAAERTGEMPTGVALVAMGGYGSRILAPYSDVDLAFLVDRDDDPPLLREAFRLVMDVLLSGAKIKIGYGYRRLSDLIRGELDHQTQTALLDARLLAGDGSLFARFDRQLAETLHLADFLFFKEAERIRVRVRAGETPFAVEPDLKEGAGGLRDVQTALWMAQARFDRKGDALWRELVRRRILTPTEMRQLQDGREHLYRLRHLLHLLSGERRDRFSIPLQEAAAERLGFAPIGDSPAVEALMHAHYEAAGLVADLSEKIVQRVMDAPIRLGGGLSAVRRAIALTRPEEVETDPLWPLRAVELCQRYELELSPPAAEAIEQHLDSSTWRTLPPQRAGAHLLALLDSPGDVLKSARRLQRVGLLGALLPELSACMGLVPYDPSHAYTIGEHSLRVLGNLVDVREGRAGQRSYRDAIAQLESPATLFLSALLHDIGKQWPRDRSGRRAPHEITGAEAIPAIGERLGFPERVTTRLATLVRWHLLLAEVSRLRDLTRPETIREVTEKLDDIDLLRMMYVHTWADTSAVGPGIWSESKAQLLDELFERAAAALESPEASEPDGEAEAQRLDALRGRLQKRLTSPGEKGEALAEAEAAREHVEAMPLTYLLNTPPETMSLHLAMLSTLEQGEEGGVVTDFRTMNSLGQTELTLVAPDDPQPGLLAKITGVLYAFSIPLHAAQVFTRPSASGPIVIDTLRIDSFGRPLERAQRGEVGVALRRVLSGEESVETLLARRRRPAPQLAAVRSVSLDAADGSDEALLDIALAPGEGNVPALAALLSSGGWNIHAARLTAWAGGLRCAFYLTDAKNSGVGTEKSRADLLESLHQNS
jgi:[protein-PII] uridylyltransferase